MTMDLYGHLIDRNLWEAARRFGDPVGTRAEASDDPESDGLRELGSGQGF
jgi:hypothetical protein